VPEEWLPDPPDEEEDEETNIGSVGVGFRRKMSPLCSQTIAKDQKSEMNEPLKNCVVEFFDTPTHR
jgi:hypothetical protein